MRYILKVYFQQGSIINHFTIYSLLTGLTPEMCEFLIKEKHVYLLRSGRISVAGVTPGNIDYIAEAIKETVVKFGGSKL